MQNLLSSTVLSPQTDRRVSRAKNQLLARVSWETVCRLSVLMCEGMNPEHVVVGRVYMPLHSTGDRKLDPGNGNWEDSCHTTKLYPLDMGCLVLGEHEIRALEWTSSRGSRILAVRNGGRWTLDYTSPSDDAARGYLGIIVEALSLDDSLLAVELSNKSAAAEELEHRRVSMLQRELSVEGIDAFIGKYLS